MNTFKKMEKDLASISKKLLEMSEFAEEYNKKQIPHKHGFEKFAEQIILSTSTESTPFEVFDYHRRLIQLLDSSDKLIINSSRRMGLTTVLFLYALYSAMEQSYQTIYWVSNSYSNVSDLFNRFEEILDLPVFKNRCTRPSDNQNRIQFSNGSAVIGWSLYGYEGFDGANTFIMDNAAYISHKELNKFWKGNDLKKIKKLVLASNPNDNRGIFYDIWTQGGIEWKKMMLPWYENPFFSPACFKAVLTPSPYANIALSDAEIRQQYCCEFICNDENPWKPIETAPRNGEFILVSCGDHVASGGTQVAIVRYNNGIWTPMYSTGAYCGAKYWMPLPYYGHKRDENCFTFFPIYYNVWITHQYRSRCGTSQRVLLAIGGEEAIKLREGLIEIAVKHGSNYPRLEEAISEIRLMFECYEPNVIKTSYPFNLWVTEHNKKMKAITGPSNGGPPYDTNIVCVFREAIVGIVSPISSYASQEVRMMFETREYSEVPNPAFGAYTKD